MMTPPPRQGRALLALAMLFVLGSGATRVPAATGSAPGPRPGGAGNGAGSAGALAAPGSARFDSTRGDSFAEPQLYMSWKAPYGMPGARADLEFTCGDTAAVDTLFLSCETGRDLPRFYGMAVRLRFHPAFGETLGTHWFFGREGANPGSVKIQLDPDGTFPCPQPWVRAGFGVPGFEYHPWMAELTFVYAVTPQDAAPISGRTRYCLARVLFEHRRCRLPGASQPVCIEWVDAQYSGGGDDIPVTRGPARFVSLNSPDGGVCAAYRRPRMPVEWNPPRTGPGAFPGALEALTDTTRH